MPRSFSFSSVNVSFSIFRGRGNVSTACPEASSLRPSSLSLACPRLCLPLLSRLLLLWGVCLPRSRNIRSNVHGRWTSRSKLQFCGFFCKPDRDLLASSRVPPGAGTDSCGRHPVLQPHCSSLRRLPRLQIGHIQVFEFELRMFQLNLKTFQE